jgi:hypothetical protein
MLSLQSKVMQAYLIADSLDHLERKIKDRQENLKIVDCLEVLTKDLFDAKIEESKKIYEEKIKAYQMLMDSTLRLANELSEDREFAQIYNCILRIHNLSSSFDKAKKWSQEEFGFMEQLEDHIKNNKDIWEQLSKVSGPIFVDALTYRREYEEFHKKNAFSSQP